MSGGRTPPLLPAALAPLQHKRRWLLWKWERRNNKWSKPPIAPDGSYVDATDRRNWLRFDDACAALAMMPTGWDGGLGFALQGSGVGALDLDRCCGAGGRRIMPWARELIARAGSYCEVTPSQGGLRILGHADGAEVHRKFGRLEIYRSCRRYICITGNAIDDAPLCDLDDLIDALIAEHDAKSRRSSTQRRIVVPNLQISTTAAPAGDWREIAQRYRVQPERVTDGVALTRRSSVIFKLVMGMYERGASPGEVATVLWAARCFRDKHGDNKKALRDEVERIFKKAAANLELAGGAR